MPTAREGRSPIHDQAFEGPIEELARSLDEGSDPNVADVNGFTPLHFAAQRLDPDRVRLLIEHGANVNAQNHFGATPTMLALMRAWADDRGVIGCSSTQVPTSTSRPSQVSALENSPKTP